ncbi:glutathione S-transferase [Sphingorhabdus lutea]|uniref:Glutathione S-transferase n=1 Tax=Sphingorhabdus lutea TaxID=1913578 RepID=A0A1L3J9W0_9SPHN|nr:glutathione S-transferase family protein [Sphingorhabdus lutea]APG61904.1 glutathione S-transferase [Sphingorhabdus lutea]
MSYILITANRNYSSWSLRPWLAMRALNIGFEERFEPFTKPSNYVEFRAFSPTGQVPVLLHEGRTIYDSLGIIIYLADRHDGIWPKNADARAWAQCATAEMHGGFSALRNDCTMNVGVRVKPKPMSAALQTDVARIKELWTEGLSKFGGPYLAGAEFSAVDAFFAPVAFRVRTYGLDVGDIGQKWVEHILAHPDMQKWEEEALKEEWREESHEQDLLSCGAIIQDYRKG